MTTSTETAAARYNRLSAEFAALRHIVPDKRTAEQRTRLGELNRELRALAAIPPDGYELPRIAADLMAHAEAHGWLAAAAWTPPDYAGEPFVKVEVGRKLAGFERDQHRGDRWHYSLTWHSRGCAPEKVKLFRSGLATTPDSPAHHDAPSIKGIRAVIEANPEPVLPSQASAPPIVAGDLYSQVLAAAKERCQCTGACGKKHLTPERKPGRCEAVDGEYAGPRKGHQRLLALPRNPLLPWHKAASQPAARLIAFCPACADGVRRAINRGVKAQPPQPDGLFDTAAYQAGDGSNPT